MATLVDAFLQLYLRKLLDVLADNFMKTRRHRVLLYFALCTSDTSHATRLTFIEIITHIYVSIVQIKNVFMINLLAPEFYI
jgi:hypothetical protein